MIFQFTRYRRSKFGMCVCLSTGNCSSGKFTSLFSQTRMTLKTEIKALNKTQLLSYSTTKIVSNLTVFSESMPLYQQFGAIITTGNLQHFLLQTFFGSSCSSGEKAKKLKKIHRAMLFWSRTFSTSHVVPNTGNRRYLRRVLNIYATSEFL